MYVRKIRAATVNLLNRDHELTEPRVLALTEPRVPALTEPRVPGLTEPRP
jgi:hypothetical protein